MAFLFSRNRQRSNNDLARMTKDLLQKAEACNDEKQLPRIEDDLSKSLAQMKITLQGSQDVEVNPLQSSQLVQQLISDDTLLPLARNLHRLSFETRKDAQAIFSNVFRHKTDTSSEPVLLSYIVRHKPEIIVALCNGYDHNDSARVCGMILREALKHDAVATLILYEEPTQDGRPSNPSTVDQAVPSSGTGVFWKFFDWIEKSAFDLSADAFSTFEHILTKHKRVVSPFLTTNMDMFVSTYMTTLISSHNYVTKRQSIKLLSTLLLERQNYTLMTRFVESSDHLKIFMNLLRDSARMIQYESFHVFKIFIANPHKSAAVERILVINKPKLLRFLPGFCDDRGDDVQFNDEKAYCIRMIEKLPDAIPSQPGSGMETQVNGARAITT